MLCTHLPWTILISWLLSLAYSCNRLLGTRVIDSFEESHGYLQLARLLCNDSVDWNHEQHEKKSCENGRPELLPQEVHAQGYGDRRRPCDVKVPRSVLQLLGVHGHQVNYHAGARLPPGGSAQSQGLSGINNIAESWERGLHNHLDGPTG